MNLVLFSDRNQQNIKLPLFCNEMFDLLHEVWNNRRLSYKS